MSAKFVTLSSKAIVVSGLQVREQMDVKHVDDLMELFDENNPIWPDGLPPLVVFHDGKAYFLADGHHRLDAAVQSGCTEIRVEVRRGTMEDALRHACGANAGHGLKRTNADKRNAIRIAHEKKLAGTEAGLARICNVSRSLVDDFLKDIGEKAKRAKQKATSQVEICSSTSSDTPGSKLPECESGATSEGDGLSNDEPSEGESVGESGAVAHPVDPGRVLSSAICDSQRAFDIADSALLNIAMSIDAIAKCPGGELLRSNYLKLKSETRGGEVRERLYSLDLENLRRELRYYRPHSPICPACNGIPNQSCNLCYGLPYLTRGAYDRLTEAQRAKLEKASTNDAA